MPLAIESNDVGFSQRAGTSALLQALRSGRSTLFVASDAPLGKPASAQELSYGAGAAAFALGAERVIARLLGSGSVTAPFVDHFRASQSRYDYFWEERWIRDEGYAKLAPAAIKAALATAGIAISDIAHFIMPSLQRGAAAATAKRNGFEGAAASGLANDVGYACAAPAPRMLANGVKHARPGQKLQHGIASWREK